MLCGVWSSITHMCLAKLNSHLCLNHMNQRANPSFTQSYKAVIIFVLTTGKKLYLLWKLLYSCALWRFAFSGSGWDSKNATPTSWAHTRGNNRLENGNWKVSLSATQTHVFRAKRLCQEKKLYLVTWWKDKNSNLEKNLDKISDMLTSNTPCYILLYLVGNVMIVTDDIPIFSIEESLYWASVS